MRDARPYAVTPEIQRRAARLGVRVIPSARADKKLDAYDVRTGAFIASFGGRGYMDYHLYAAQDGPVVARAKRQQYKKRHQRDRTVKFRNGKLTPGYLADRILW